MSRVRLRMDDGLLTRLLARQTEALEAGAQTVLEASRAQAPLEDGALIASSRVTSAGVNAVISYDTPYAVRWHEESAAFRYGRKRRYLIDPLLDAGVQRTALEAMAQILRQGFGGT